MELIINLKNYKHGEKALELAKKLEKINQNIILGVSSIDISYLNKKTKLKLFAQHIDSINDERATGFLTAKAIKSHGAKGTFLNHSEHPIKFNDLKTAVNICKKQNLKIIIFAKNLREAKKIMRLSPYAIAYEDPKLISTGKSITKYKSSKISKFAKLLKGTKIISLCGAGISSKEDIKKAEEFGCKGVALSSAIAKRGNLKILE